MKKEPTYFVSPRIQPQSAASSKLQVKKPAHTWFPGLNALRFFAAGLVIVMHVHNNMGQSNLPQLPAFPLLFKGLTAVSFFFVLSGFLITYLLLQEQDSRGEVSIRHFYLRRVFRIWPLYFIVVAAGMFFYWQLVPALHLRFETSYPHALAILLYSFFLANLMNSLYHVGGMLHIAWSISVEEQFYLFWAPLFKKFNRQLPALIIGITSLSLLVAVCNSFNAFGLSPEMKAFVDTLQFHYMGLGAGLAWLLWSKKEWLLQLPVFSSKTFQWVLTMLIVLYLCLYMKSPLGDAISPLPMGLLFGWLIVNVAANPNRIFSLENRFLNFMGKISYGLYMYHMPVVYAVSFLFQKSKLATLSPLAYFPLFFGLVFIVTTGIAGSSYYLIEQPLLKKSKRLF